MEIGDTAEHQTISNYLTDLWKKVLGRNVNPTDDFFDAGGDSLTALRMIIEVQSAYNVEIDVEVFFEAPCIARLASMIAKESTTVPGPERK